LSYQIGNLRDAPVKKYIPKNYYCKYTIELKDDLVYGIDVYRYDRYKSRETIDLDVIINYDDDT
jgi:hypothetical protein